MNNQKLQKRIQEELDFDLVMRQRTQLGFTGLAEEQEYIDEADFRTQIRAFDKDKDQNQFDLSFVGHEMDSEKNVQVVVHSGAVDGRKVPDSLGNDIEQEREEEEESRSVIFSDSSLASAMNCAMLSSRKKSLGKV